MKKRRVLHIISQAHIDPVWLWPWRDGCSESLTTMQSALDWMREIKEFRFSRSCASVYRWAQEMDPRLFREIRKRIKEGRWEVVNGWIVQPDCNIPSTESFVRQSLEGKRYFAEYLGVEPVVGYNIDSFGHSGGLPQLLRRAGFKYYVFMRPMVDELDIPMLFWWESADGSRVLAWRLPVAYCQSPAETPEGIERLIRAAATENFPPGFSDGVFLLGVGNHGGGPTKRHLKKIRELQRDSSLPELRFSTLKHFFESIEKSPAFSTIPAVCTELQHNARGCYSAMGEIKQLNRRAERTLTEAETLSTILSIFHRSAYPKGELKEAWWRVLFNQFHDILAGSCVEPVYADVRDSLGAACDAGRRTIVLATHALARKVDTSGAPGSVLFLMNTLPWRRKAVVQFDTFVAPDGARPITHLVTQSG